MKLTPEEQARWNEHQLCSQKKTGNQLPPEKVQKIIDAWNENPSINHVIREAQTGFVPAKKVLKSRGLIQ